MPDPLLILGVTVLVLALLAAWLTRQLANARNELKSLSGLLPMCAWCKKIRDDAGYWQQLEGYIQSHTHVEFSHSMCPDCTEKARGDMPDAKWRI